MRRSRVLVAALPCLLGACIGNELPPSVWPPRDFSLMVTETTYGDEEAHVVRRFRVDDDGVVVYGTSSSPLIDAETGFSLPVFDRLCVYRLEPNALRLLARRLHRLRITEIIPGVHRVRGDSGIRIEWRAFGESVQLPAQGRLRGAIAEIAAVIAAFLPPGESFDTPMERRQVVPILRGVPQPATGAAPALAQLQERLDERPGDQTLLLDAFALACAVGRRDVATELLDQWIEWGRAAAEQSPFVDPSATRRTAQDLLGFVPGG